MHLQLIAIDTGNIPKIQATAYKLHYTSHNKMYVYVFTHDLIAYSGIAIGGVILIWVEAQGCRNPVHVNE